MKARSPGFTMVEVIMMLAIVSIGVLSMIGTFSFIKKGIQTTRMKSLANNLAQEKIESLKNLSYYQLFVTTAATADANFSGMYYDSGTINAPDTINVAGVNFTRKVYIRKCSDGGGGILNYYGWTTPDTGMKEIWVYVSWQESGNWKKLELHNVLENPNQAPLNSTFTGNVKDSANSSNIQSATVLVLQDTARYGTTDASGNYSFAIQVGTYTLRAYKTGYFFSVIPNLAVSAGQTLSENFSLVRMASGTIQGAVFKRDHLVISQICAAVTNDTTEYVELYNPTTWTWTINASTVKLKYIDGSNNVYNLSSSPGFTYVNTSISPSGYYLFASQPAVNGIAADAYYPTPSNQIPIRTNGGVALTNAYDVWIDSVAWGRSNASAPPPPAGIEGSGYIMPNAPGHGGMEINESIQRKATSSSTASSMDQGGSEAQSGTAWDSNVNNNDWVDHSDSNHALETNPYPEKNSSVVESPQSGTPAAGALVSASDGLSVSTNADSGGNFSLVGVATGSWNVTASSGALSNVVGLYGGLTNGFSVTTPNIYLTSATTGGYVAGSVTTISGAALGSILMSAAGSQTRTLSDGSYIISCSTGMGTINVIANYTSDNASYTQGLVVGTTVYLGQITGGINFALSQGGGIKGWVTTNGVDALPNISISAQQSGTEIGNGVSGADGNFAIPSLATGTYILLPQLDSGESVTPSSTTVTVTSGNLVSAGTFTVTGAMGYISGTMTSGSLSGPPVTTGVLVYITTSTISSGSPPSINSSFRSGAVIYYGASSRADGTYQVALRGGSAYNVYAWYTTWNGQTPTTTAQSATSVSVTAGKTTTQNFYW